MKSFKKHIRSFVYTIVLAVTISGIFTVNAFTKPSVLETRAVYDDTICPECYIVYVWIEGVRWVQVYDADGKMINMYPEIE